MVKLRPYKACDAKTIVSWVKDEDTYHKWCADLIGTYPITKEDLNTHYDKIAYEDNFYEMTAYDETGVVGHLIMRFTDEKKEVIRFGFVIVDDTKRGKGYGKQMLQLAIQYATQMLGVTRITLGVFANNEAAYHCYKSVGFVEDKEKQGAVLQVANESWSCIELYYDII